MYTDYNIHLQDSGLNGGSLERATVHGWLYYPECTMPNAVDLQRPECADLSQDLVTQGIFQGWEGRLWRHRRDPRGCIPAEDRPKKGGLLCQGECHGGPIGFGLAGVILESVVVCWAGKAGWCASGGWCVLSIALRRLVRCIMAGGKSWPRLAGSKFCWSRASRPGRRG